MLNIDNQNTIGIPRAISYYHNYPFYYGFFKALDIKIILSDKTTSEIINDGTDTVVSDTCLPVKVFAGHIINLLKKGCDKIFIPSIQSTGYKINNCSKIRGLPEIIRNVINTGFTIVEPELNKTDNIGIKDFCCQTASYFGIYDNDIIENAVKQGWILYNRFLKLAKSRVEYKEALKCVLENKEPVIKYNPAKKISVAIMAHGYNLFDERISLNLIKKLEKMNVAVYTSLDVERDTAFKSIKDIGEVQYWANELELTGVAANYILNNSVDGIIALSAFGCGPDSLMVDEISNQCVSRGLPLIHLTIDEHTGEAGFVTRLEAFIDMLDRKKRYKNHPYENAVPVQSRNIKQIQKELAESIA